MDAEREREVNCIESKGNCNMERKEEIHMKTKPAGVMNDKER